MSKFFNLLMLTSIALAGCSKAMNRKPVLPDIDHAELVSTLQEYFDDHQTCAILPGQFRNFWPGRKARVSVEKLKNVTANHRKIPQVFIDAGLIRVVETPAAYAGQYIYYEFTELGRSSYSYDCRGWNEARGESFKTRGFPVFDIEVAEILSSRPPYGGTCIWHTNVTYKVTLNNSRPWYDPRVFEPYVSRKLNPQKNGTNFVWDSNFHFFVGGWRIGNFDYIHSNYVCPDRIED